MDLDFSALERISRDNTPKMPDNPQNQAIDELNPNNLYKSTPEEQNALNGQKTASDAMPALQRQADAVRAERERAIEIWNEHQKNIKITGQLQTDILKGVKRGEDIYSLFLKAIKAISLMTSNSLFYSQIEADLIAIYGAGLLQAPPLEMELEGVQERLKRLRDATERETGDSLAQINTAIRYHEQRKAELQQLIQQTRSGRS